MAISMADMGQVSRPVVESLLAALRAMGRGASAEVFERDFDARAWALGVEDQHRLLEALRPDAQLSLVPEPSLPLVPQVPDAERSPSPWPKALHHHQSFLASIRDGSTILRAVEQLVRSRGWEAVKTSVAGMFVEVLGFEADEVDLLPRMTGRSQIGRFTTVARHGDFLIALVELTEELSDTRWSVASAHYAACFRLVPYGLLVAIEPGTGTLRLVYQQTRRGEASRPRYRALVGPWFFRDPHDDIVTWTRRFELLRPRFGEEHLELRGRTETVLDTPAAGLASDWSSIPLSDTEPLPGLPFGPAGMVAGMAAFLQQDVHPTERVAWGLEAALRQVFPTPLVWGQSRLACDGYSLESKDRSPDESWRLGQTLDRTVRLHLRPTGWRGEVVREGEFDLLVSLPVPDEAGRYLVDGQPRIYRPRIDEDGRFTSDAGVEDDEVDEADSEVDDPPDDEAVGEPPATGAFEIALQRAIEQRLGQHLRMVRATLQRLAPPDPRSPDLVRYVRAALALRTDERGRIPLVARTWLRRHLAPVAFEDALLGEAHCEGVPHHIPAWACPERSSPMDGRWVVVSGARVHPVGVFVLPLARDGVLRLAIPTGSATDHNPRLGGDGSGPRTWWVAPELARWAHLRHGLSRPHDLALTVPVSAKVVVRSTALPEDAAWVRPGLRPRSVPRVRCAVDVASRRKGEDRPELLLRAGTRVSGGAPWLVVPWALVPWHAPPEPPLVDDVLAEIAPPGTISPRMEGVSHDLPAGQWLVLAVGLETLTTPFGAPSGWRAWVEVVRLDVVPTTLVDNQGRWYRLIDHPDDLPWDAETGDEPDVVLGAREGDVEPDLPWFSGADGEVSATRTEDVGVFWLHPAGAALEREPIGRRLIPSDLQVRRGFAQYQLREWAALDPVHFAAALPAAQSIPAHARALLAAARVLLAAGVALPMGTFPPEWAGTPTTRRTERLRLSEVIPSESTLPRFAAQAAHQANDRSVLVDVACACGGRRGARWRGARCPNCGEAVRERITRADQVSALSLPWPVLHPWRKDLAAALLGLTEPEFEEVLATWGPVHLRPTLLAALTDPLSAGHRRLRGQDASPLHGRQRRILALSLLRLERRLRVDPRLDGLWMSLLPVPAPELMPVGLLVGAGSPVASPLAGALQGVRRALLVQWDLVREASPAIRRAAHVSLQHAVDRLFGSAVEESGFGSLAAILAATWPWTRPGAERTGILGMVHIGGEPIDGPEDGRDDVYPLDWDEKVAAREARGPQVVAELREVEDPQVGRTSVARLLGALPGRHRAWIAALTMKYPDLHDLRAVEWPALVQVLNDWERKWAYRLIAGRSPAETGDELLAALLRAGRTRFERVRADPEPAAPGDASGATLWARASLTGATSVAVRVKDRWLFPPPPTIPSTSWPVERARCQIRQRWWPWLAAVLDHVGRTKPLAKGVAPADLALAGLAVALREGRPGLVGLTALLESTRSVVLPQDLAEAHASVRQNLAGLVDGSVASTTLVELLTLAWTGWGIGEPTEEEPVGARWSADTPGPGLRRTLLGADHPVWLTWPGVVFVSRPTWFVDEDEVGGWTPGDVLHRWVGGRVASTPDLAWALEPPLPVTAPDFVEPVSPVTTDIDELTPLIVDPVTSAPDNPTPTPEPALTPPAPMTRTTDIRWIDDSVALWLRRTPAGAP